MQEAESETGLAEGSLFTYFNFPSKKGKKKMGAPSTEKTT